MLTGHVALPSDRRLPEAGWSSQVGFPAAYAQFDLVHTFTRARSEKRANVARIDKKQPAFQVKIWVVCIRHLPVLLRPIPPLLPTP